MGGFLYKATMSLRKEYGPVVGVRVGKDRQVICQDYPSIKEMLTNEDLDGRPQGPFYETRTWGARRGILYGLKLNVFRRSFHCTKLQIINNTNEINYS